MTETHYTRWSACYLQIHHWPSGERKNRPYSNLRSNCVVDEVLHCRNLIKIDGQMLMIWTEMRFSTRYQWLEWDAIKSVVTNWVRILKAEWQSNAEIVDFCWRDGTLVICKVLIEGSQQHVHRVRKPDLREHMMPWKGPRVVWEGFPNRLVYKVCGYVAAKRLG